MKNLNVNVYENSKVPQFNSLVIDFLQSNTVDFSFENDGYIILPGLCDVHVHFREPGFSYKETIASGARSAAAGGYTACCTMANLNPVPDNVENIQKQIDIINRDSCINIYPYASITEGEHGDKLVDMQALKNLAVAFSDDGRGVQSEGMMKEAMIKAKEVDRLIVAHCEVEELIKGGYIHDGEYAKKNNHRGICSESEYAQVARDIELARQTGAKYHICHISAKETVELVRQAKREGVDVTCETAPHYLILNDMDLQEDGFFKMNPPLRSKEDQEALIEGILDGTIDMIATDHAPHTMSEKTKGLANSSFGIVGLETAFPLMYTEFVKKGILSLDRLMELMVINPRKRFNIPLGLDFAVWDLNKMYEIDNTKFKTKGRATPFNGRKVWGKCMMTVVGGKRVW